MTADPTLPGTRVVLVPVAAEHVPTRFAVLVEGAVRGMVQYSEGDEPDYRHASIDIFLDPAIHGRGVGRDTVATLARYLTHDRGHHRL